MVVVFVLQPKSSESPPPVAVGKNVSNIPLAKPVESDVDAPLPSSNRQ